MHLVVKPSNKTKKIQRIAVVVQLVVVLVAVVVVVVRVIPNRKRIRCLVRKKEEKKKTTTAMNEVAASTFQGRFHLGDREGLKLFGRTVEQSGNKGTFYLFFFSLLLLQYTVIQKKS